MKYLLACKHTGIAKMFTELEMFMLCPVCHVPRKLVAVETREWHVKCDDCSYGRYYGQSHNEAKSALSRHNNQHNVHIDYSYYPAKYERVKDIFGRKVRRFIDESVSYKFMPNKLIEVTARQAELNFDEPPF